MPLTMDDFLNDLNRDPQLRRAFEDAIAAFARQRGYAVDAKDVEVAGLTKKDKTDQPQPRDLDGPVATTLAMGEEDKKPTPPRIDATSFALGEEDDAPRASVTLAIGEEDKRNDGPVATTLAMGEEEKIPTSRFTSAALGEEDKKPTPPRIDATSLALGEEEPRRGKPKKGAPKPK